MNVYFYEIADDEEWASGGCAIVAKGFDEVQKLFESYRTKHLLDRDGGDVKLYQSMKDAKAERTYKHGHRLDGATAFIFKEALITTENAKPRVIMFVYHCG